MKNIRRIGIAALSALLLWGNAVPAFSRYSHYRNYPSVCQELERRLQDRRIHYEYFKRAAGKCVDEEKYSPSDNISNLGWECYGDNMMRAYAAQRDIAELENTLKQIKCPVLVP